MKRIGLMIPSSNTVMEPEAFRVIGSAATVHTSRIRLTEVTMDALDRMLDDVDYEAQKLADADVDVILYGCTSGSFFRGFGFDREVERRIEKITGIKSISTSRAVVEALKSLGMKKIAVATPYIEQVNKAETKFLKANGFEITDFRGMGLKENLMIGRVRPEQVFELASGMKSKVADGLFISCTNLSTLDVIERLESLLSKPVVSSNTASFWGALRHVDSRKNVEGYGTLLRSFKTD